MDNKDKYQGKVSKDPHFGSEWSFTDEQLRSFAAENGLPMPKLPDGWHLEGEQHDCDDEGARPPVVMVYLRFRDFDSGVFVMLGEKAPYCFPDESEFFDIMSQSETLDEYIANTRSLAALRDACADGFPTIVSRLGRLDLPWDDAREEAWLASHGIGPDDDYYLNDHTPILSPSLVEA